MLFNLKYLIQGRSMKIVLRNKTLIAYRQEDTFNCIEYSLLVQEKNLLFHKKLFERSVTFNGCLKKRRGTGSSPISVANPILP